MATPTILILMLSISGVLLFISIVYFIYKWYTSDRDLPPPNIWENFLDYNPESPSSDYSLI